MTKTVKQIVDEYLSRKNSRTYNEILVQDRSYRERFSHVRNLIELPGKIEFDFHAPTGEWNSNIHDFERSWVHKEFESPNVKIVDREQKIIE